MMNEEALATMGKKIEVRLRPWTMKYFIDTEFVEDGKTIELLSIGIAADDGREFYAENSEANLSRADDWVRENVVRHLWSQQPGGWDGVPKPCFIAGGIMPIGMIARMVREFCDAERYGAPEFWGYYADYDWVVFCQLFGRMIDLPKGFPMYCRDIMQLVDQKRILKDSLPKQNETEHHALADARWNKDAYEYADKAPDPLKFVSAWSTADRWGSGDGGEKEQLTSG